MIVILPRPAIEIAGYYLSDYYETLS